MVASRDRFIARRGRPSQEVRALARTARRTPTPSGRCEHASEVTALIRRERALKKLAFGVPVAALRVPGRLEPDWRAIAGDVLAGNNARRRAGRRSATTCR